MNRQQRIPMAWMIAVVSIAVLPSLIAVVAADKAPPAPAASTFAPADDLVDQFDYYIKRIEETLANKAEFDDAAKTKLKKDANTLSALALTLGLHDAKNRLQNSPGRPNSAGAVVAASQKIGAAGDFDAAQAGFAELKKGMNGEVAGPPPTLKWEKVASLEQLMKQVPTINAALKRGVTPQRFKTLQKQSAGQAATLAAIAQTVMADMPEVKNGADEAKWYQFCGEMRDAAGAVNTAIRADDQAATTTAMSRLAASCETCHKVFRKEKD